MSTHPFGVEASEGKLFVWGEVDLAVRAELLEAILAAGHDTEGSELVVDLSNVSFIDSTGIGTLVHGAQGLAADGVTLRVIAASDAVERIITISGVGTILAYEPI